jgi:molybdenum cofactor guanylyltransferase
MKTTAIVLSGGRGIRAGGADKGLLPWENSTLVETVIDLIRPQVDHILVSCNRNFERYQKLGLPLVNDQLENFQGPLAGIAAALPVIKTELAVVVPCDCPTVPTDLVQRLMLPLAESAIDLSWAFDGRRDQYLFTALRRGLGASIESYLADGGRSMRGWHERLRCRAVDFSDCEAAFINLNESAEIERP